MTTATIAPLTLAPVDTGPEIPVRLAAYLEAPRPDYRTAHPQEGRLMDAMTMGRRGLAPLDIHPRALLVDENGQAWLRSPWAHYLAPEQPTAVRAVSIDPGEWARRERARSGISVAFYRLAAGPLMVDVTVRAGSSIGAAFLRTLLAHHPRNYGRSPSDAAYRPDFVVFTLPRGPFHPPSVLDTNDPESRFGRDDREAPNDFAILTWHELDGEPTHEQIPEHGRRPLGPAAN